MVFSLLQETPEVTSEVHMVKASVFMPSYRQASRIGLENTGCIEMFTDWLPEQLFILASIVRASRITRRYCVQGM